MAARQVRLKQTEKGSTLYHYTKSNGVNGIMNHNCFWATKSDFLNDPDEFLYIRKIINEVCLENIPKESRRKMFLKDILDENTFFTGGNYKEYFVLSFSNCHDSITMWSEFGAKTGYKIGFQSEKIIRRIEEANTVDYHGFVIYDLKRQKKLIQKIICDYIPGLLKIPLEDLLAAGEKNRKDAAYRKACRKFHKIATVYAMFFKHESFREEQEYRFVFQKQKDTVVNFREKDGFLIPYIEIQLSQDPLPVNEIMVAPQNHIDLAKKGMEYLLKSKGYDVRVTLSDIKLRY